MKKEGDKVDVYRMEDMISKEEHEVKILRLQLKEKNQECRLADLKIKELKR